MQRVLSHLKRLFRARERVTPASTFHVPKTSKRMQRFNAEQLLTPHQAELDEIREIAGVTPEHFAHYYLKPIERYAELIQLAPASELHHHAHVGGMLEHNLQVILNALRIRRGQILPPGVIAEDIERKKDIWTYAVFVCALLHDIGKPITDFCYLDPNGNSWNLLSTNPMPKTYEIHFRKGRVHKLHEKLPLLAIYKIFDPHAIDWLSSDPLVFQHFASFLAGDYPSTPLLSDMIQKADQLSVAGNLGGDVKQIIATTAERPLYERFLHTLRQMLLDDAIPMNRKGAAAFVQEDRVYFVSKRLLDEVKERMRKEGQSVPGRNDRLMDELQQFKVLIPNGDKAIWRCKVQIDEWEMNLSMLCMDTGKVWPNREDRPQAVANQAITPIDANGDLLQSEKLSAPKENQIPKSEPDLKAPPAPKDQKTEAAPESKKTEPELDKLDTNDLQNMIINETESTPATTLKASKSEAELEEVEALLASNPAPDLIGDFSDFAEDAYDSYDADQDLKTETPLLDAEISDTENSDTRLPIIETIKTQASMGRSNSVAYHNQKVAEQADIQLEFDDPDCPAAHFLRWLQEGVANAKIPVNNPANQVHFVDAGLFLVSPAIFKTFERDQRISWSVTQRDLTRKKINLKTPKGDNIFQYEVMSKSGRNGSRIIKGILIPNPEKIGLKSTQLNAYLHPIT